MTEFIQVSTTVNSKAAASRIAKTLLEERLASCVQVLDPVESGYWWKNSIEHAREWFCLVKARATDYHKTEASIKKAHPYEIPEILFGC